MAVLSGRRILVLDDEPLAALMMERMLKELGCSVPGRTGKAADAMAIIETDRLGLDAVTVSLANAGSAEVMALLDHRAIPFLVTVSSDSPMIAGRSEKRPVLVKPYLLEDLKRALSVLNFRQRHSTR
jgi:CheY-like chemotaxis protein